MLSLDDTCVTLLYSLFRSRHNRETAIHESWRRALDNVGRLIQDSGCNGTSWTDFEYIWKILADYLDAAIHEHGEGDFETWHVQFNSDESPISDYFVFVLIEVDGKINDNPSVSRAGLLRT